MGRALTALGGNDDKLVEKNKTENTKRATIFLLMIYDFSKTIATAYAHTPSSLPT